MSVVHIAVSINSITENYPSTLRLCVGSDLHLVSAAVMGLQSLLTPLEWVAPAISVLPLKLLEFLECPVPLMAGLEVVGLSHTGHALSVRNIPGGSAPPPYFSPRELNSTDYGVGGGVGGGGEADVRGGTGTPRQASLRAARLLQRCG